MIDGIVKALQKLGFTFKNPAIEEILAGIPSVVAIETRFYTVLTRIDLKRLKQEGKPYLELFRKLVTENYQKNRVSDIEVYTNAYFKAILDQIGVDVKFSQELIKPHRKAIFDYYLKEKDALIHHFIAVFMDEVSKNAGTLRQVDLMYVHFVFNKAQNGCIAKCNKVFAENPHIEDVCKSFASLIKAMKLVQSSVESFVQTK